MLRVLHLNAGNLYGGIETALRSLARLQFKCQGMQFEFGLCFDGRHRDELLETGSSVHSLGSVRLSRPWTTWNARNLLKRVVEHSSPDVIVTHGSWVHSIFGPVVRKLKLPFATWVHGTSETMTWLENLTAKTQPDVVIANSLHTLNCARRIFPTCKADVVYYPYEPQPISDCVLLRNNYRRELGIDDQDFVIISINRMESWKGHRILIDAIKQLDRHPHVKAVLVGGAQRPEESQYLQSLKDQVRKLGLETKVQFLGQRQDARALLSCADVFCQPNLSPEPFGLVFIEALHAGLPVITTDFGGAQEIVTSECGRLVRSNESQGVADAIRFVMQDKTFRESCSIVGPKRADELCNPERQMKKIESVFRALVNCECDVPLRCEDASE